MADHTSRLEHRYLHKVGGRSLYHRVDCLSPTPRLLGWVGVVDVCHREGVGMTGIGWVGISICHSVGEEDLAGAVGVQEQS